MTAEQAEQIVRAEFPLAACCQMCLGSFRVYKHRNSIERIPPKDIKESCWTRGQAWKVAAAYVLRLQQRRDRRRIQQRNSGKKE